MRMLKKNLNRPQLMRLLKLDEAIRSGTHPNCFSFAKSEEREWHPEQTIRRFKDRSIVLSFPAPSLYEVERWVAEWGGEAEIIKDNFDIIPSIFHER